MRERSGEKRSIKEDPSFFHKLQAAFPGADLKELETTEDLGGFSEDDLLRCKNYPLFDVTGIG